MGLNFRCVGDGTQKRIMAFLGSVEVVSGPSMYGNLLTTTP